MQAKEMSSGAHHPCAIFVDGALSEYYALRFLAENSATVAL